MLRTTVAIATALFLASGAWAQEKDRQSTAQQERMKSCNAQASKKELKGDERKAFMSQCLSAKGGEKKELTAQQKKMRSCNAQANRRDLKGDKRREFMSGCLSA
jgi:hypothetical protein